MKLNIRYYVYKRIAVLMAVLILSEILVPTVTYALTSGPSQPEVQSFEPVTTTEMVDLFSGDFTYNIPLFELPGPNGGYPFNMHYNSGITMDQEASWIGLGWNLNPGAITRQMQGLPDEYDGKAVKRELDIKPNTTGGAFVSGDLEFYGAGMKFVPSLGLSVKYNNYKGFGYSIESGLDVSGATGTDRTAGAGLHVSLDSYSGFGVNVRAQYSMQSRGADGLSSSAGGIIGVGYNTRQGLSEYSLEGNYTKHTGTITKVNSKSLLQAPTYKKQGFSLEGKSSYSVTSGGYIPHSAHPMMTRYTTLSFKVGGGAYGLYGHLKVGGMISSQYIAPSAQLQQTTSYGYLFSQNDQGGGMLDFNRDQDGMLHKSSEHLPIPVTTPDIFMMTNQQVSTMFRAYRNDFGVLHDPRTESQAVGGSMGAELIGTHWGGDITFGYGETKIDKWTANNSADEQFNFKKNTTAGGENYYFKTYGEYTAIDKNTYQGIGYEEPVGIYTDFTGALDIPNINPNTTEKLEKKYGQLIDSPIGSVNDNTRASRNTPIQYINPSDPSKGMYSINSDGSAYVYGIAQMVKKNIECTYSVNGSLDDCAKTAPNIEKVGSGENAKPKYDGNPNIDYYFSRNTLTDYAYSYLITEIRGVDYVDSDGNGEVSDGDKGYWIKFNYDKVTENPLFQNSVYKWRTPFSGATYLPGKLTTQVDNKAHYSYGEKDIYYLNNVETSSHVAKFHISKRKDARGAFEELNSGYSTQTRDAYSYKLEYISLHPKVNQSQTLLKVMFEYSYNLCKGIPNNDGSTDTYIRSGENLLNAGGKLTLKKVWVEYENSKRGKMNAYKFDYNETSLSDNPTYTEGHYDRWGYNRKKLNVDDVDCANPYIKQFDNSNSNHRTDMDATISAWNLRKITLPSGALINVEYEADDYAYVQNQKAAQMFKITSLDGVFDNDGSYNANTNDRKVYFDLEHPIPNDGQAYSTFEKQYFKGIDKIYFRVYGQMVADDARRDYVSGYVDVKSKGLVEPAGGGAFTKGYVELDKPRMGTKKHPKQFDYHPFAVAFWQALMTDYSEIPFTGKVGNFDGNKQERREKLKSLVSVFGEVRAMFAGFYKYANESGWGQKIDLQKSFIRLSAPDGVKIGGGVRVKKITLSDQWSSMESGAQNAEYGQVYDYTKMLSDGVTKISSGVATYEPMIGGDENIIRTAKEYMDAIPLKLSNRFYFEYPINESYYPGASVGYSKVTIKSLASHYNENKTAPGSFVPSTANILTTGATINEFYTCKDFPVITDKTDIRNNRVILYKQIPLIGSIKDVRVTATQGYSIALNDMHGKMKQVTTCKQADDGTILYDDPVSYVKYNYACKTETPTTDPDDNYYILTNNLPVLRKNSSGTLVKSNNYLLGQQIEFFTDMREDIVNNTTGGVGINVDLFFLTFITVPIPAVWPMFTYERTRVRTIATNKIITRFGILQEIEASNGSSMVKTQNLVFDAQTGQPVLTSVTNNYNDPVFNYNLPAFLVYPGMEPAYKTIGLTFSGSLTAQSTGVAVNNKEYLLTVASEDASKSALLLRGDICEFYYTVGGVSKKFTATISRISGSSIYIQTALPTASLPSASINFILSYPARKNILTVQAGTVQTLGDSTLGLLYNPIDQLYTTEPTF